MGLEKVSIGSLFSSKGSLIIIGHPAYDLHHFLTFMLNNLSLFQQCLMGLKTDFFFIFLLPIKSRTQWGLVTVIQLTRSSIKMSLILVLFFGVKVVEPTIF